MSVYNEYSKLKTILIGKLLPTECLKELALPSDKDILPTLIKIHEETNKDLDALQKFFEGKGIKVYRPNINKYYEEVRDKTKSAPPNPSTIRDWCFSYGDDIILSKTYCPNRWYEWLYWKDVFDELEEQGKTIHHIVDENEFDFDVFAKISNSLLDRYETYSQRRVLKDLKFNFSQIQNINSEWDEIRKSYYKKTIKDLERLSKEKNQSQIFIETPYRNEKLFTDLKSTLTPSTLLCIAADITLSTEYIKTKHTKDWKQEQPDLHKRPAIFIIHKEY